ncbi:MAG: CsgG/HfaB family protein [Candidatus Edwardsbacteria bacterium]|jgi:TolB-like protein|nr:CsgG/HfaB family protein [Candidatus Edwardsbacteria bacterium]
MKRLMSVLAVIVLCCLAAAPAAQAQKAAKRATVAILDLEPKGVPENEVSALSDRLRTELFQTDAFDVMERGKMQEILREQGFQQSGACNSDACAVEVGQMIGVEKMIAGSLGKVGRTYTVNLRMINVKTGRMERSVTKDYEGDIDKLLTNVMKTVAQVMANSVGAQQGSAALAASAKQDDGGGKPIYKKWWFYAGIGGLAAGGAAAALLGGSSSDGVTETPVDNTIPGPPARP